MPALYGRQDAFCYVVVRGERQGEVSNSIHIQSIAKRNREIAAAADTATDAKSNSENASSAQKYRTPIAPKSAIVALRNIGYPQPR